MDQPGQILCGNSASEMKSNPSRHIRTTYLCFLVILVLSACSRHPGSSATASSPTAIRLAPSATHSPETPTLTPTRTATSTATSTPTPTFAVCSPLESIPIEALERIVSNPFAPPSRVGSDDPHQGVDLADIDPVTRISLEGRPVQAALAGTVSAVILDRFPYGNAVLIETPLRNLPAEWKEALSIPTPAPTSLTHPVLTCPTPEFTPVWDSSERSVYILYAHLQDELPLKPGETVQCGQQVGNLGGSGNALNPHVHVEARVGPAGVSFASMAHYTGNATHEEQRNYCLWRVSANFQLIDPLRLLLSTP